MRLLIKGLAGEWMRMDATFGVGHLQKPIYTPQDNLLNIDRDRDRERELRIVMPQGEGRRKRRW